MTAAVTVKAGKVVGEGEKEGEMEAAMEVVEEEEMWYRKSIRKYWIQR